MDKRVELHPIFDRCALYYDHFLHECGSLGDELGRDCVVHAQIDGWMRPYAGDGRRNEDWYGWHARVLAPFSGVVTRIIHNPVTNQPGHSGHGPASCLFVTRADGLNVVYAHVDSPFVQEGCPVEAGQPVALVGNNGESQMPHIHIGAWMDNHPQAVCFDPATMEALVNRVGAAWWLRGEGDPKW